jgi:hypothetical protein
MTKRGRTYPDLFAENLKGVVVFVIVIFIIVLGLILSKTYFKIGSFEVGSQPNIIRDSTPSNSSVQVSGKQNINGNGNTIINNPIQNTNKKQNEYSIIGTSNQELISQILKKRKIRFVASSSSNIEISYTGMIVLVDKNSNAYYYSGGHIKIMINKRNCIEFEEFNIDEMRPSSKDQIANEIQKSIDRHINSNLELFTNKIIGCLKI